MGVRYRVNRRHNERRIQRRRPKAEMAAIAHTISYHSNLTKLTDVCHQSTAEAQGLAKPRRKTYSSNHSQVIFNTPYSRRCSRQASSNIDPE